MAESSSVAMGGESATRAATHSYDVLRGEPAARAAALRDGQRERTGSRCVSTAPNAGETFIGRGHRCPGLGEMIVRWLENRAGLGEVIGFPFLHPCARAGGGDRTGGGRRTKQKSCTKSCSHFGLFSCRRGDSQPQRSSSIYIWKFFCTRTCSYSHLQ